MPDKVKKSALSQLRQGDNEQGDKKPSAQKHTEPKLIAASSDVYVKKFSIISSDLEGEVFAREYPRLKSSLSLGVNKMSYSHLIEAVDKVAEDSRIAGNLYVAAREDHERFEKMEFAVWWSEVYNDAMKELEKMKKRGEISGQVGDEKVRNFVIGKHKTKYKEMNEKLVQLRTVRDTLEILYEQWRSRKSLLQTQGNMIEKRITVEGKK